MSWTLLKDTLGLPAATEIKLEEHCPYKLVHYFITFLLISYKIKSFSFGMCNK